MELWVRSQDKMELVKINYCYIMDQQDHFTIIGETIDSGPIIATYKSKQRALEVLDEIQNSILGILSLEDIEKQEIKKYTGKATFSKVTKQLVYIMPEE